MSKRCAEVHSAYGLTVRCMLDADHDGPCITTTLEPGFSPEFVILDEKHHYKHTL